MKKTISLLLCVMILAAGIAAALAEDAIVVRGMWAGSLYTNEYAGITFDMPSEGWVAATDEQMAEIIGIGYTAMGQSGVEMPAPKFDGTIVADMLAVNYSNKSTVSVIYEKINPMYNEKMYFEITKGQYSKYGEYVTFGEIEERWLGGTMYYCRASALSFGEINTAQLIYVRIIGDILVCISISAGDGNWESIEACFK